MLSGLQFLFSTQSLATTIARSLFDATRSLLSRLAITIFMFGWDTTVSVEQARVVQTSSFISYFQINGIIQTADPFTIGDFLFNPGLIVLIVGRTIAQITFFFAAIGPIYKFATDVWPNIPRTETTSKTTTCRVAFHHHFQGC